MKRFIAFFLTSFVCYSVIAGISPLPSVNAPLAKKSLLLDIVNVEQQKLVAVGERGHILLSSDAVHWQQMPVPVQATLTGVYFANAMKGWAVGHDATIINTLDGGKTWHIQQFLPQLEKPLLDVVFKNDMEGITVGAYGQFFRTEDGGSTWQSEFHDEFLLPEDIEYLEELKKDDEEAYLDERRSILPHFNRVVLDGRTLYLVGEIGIIAKSNDFGKHWQKLAAIYQGSFFDLTRTQRGNLLVVGLRGNAFRSLKNGAPWQHSETKTTALLNSIVLSDDNRVFVLGNNGVVLESSDDGKTYTQHIQEDGKPLIAGVWFNSKIIAVSDVGIKTITLNTSGFN
ncbi:MAG: photosystem II stability/assembly factor-like uncharacterized protein [Alteromonadaceae bacterium]|jgi:photosystem II stability/assembly factor-like uncharacterized protein